MICGAVFLLIGFVIFISSANETKQPAVSPKIGNIAVAPATDSVLSKNEKVPIRKIVKKKPYNDDQIISIKEKKSETSTVKTETDKIDQNKRNGNDFEKFIVQKFNKNYFTIKEWAGDKYVKGIYAETTQNPDILFEFKLKDEVRLFSVECKWRKNLYKNGVEFAEESQLARYRKFESEKNVPVFIAIGISGEASHPEHLYIIPLKNINSTFLTIEELSRYEKKDDKNFYYNLKTNKLN